jgi:hypothetical protein
LEIGDTAVLETCGTLRAFFPSSVGLWLLNIECSLQRWELAGRRGSQKTSTEP